jgi:hypothetical protein
VRLGFGSDVRIKRLDSEAASPVFDAGIFGVILDLEA